jgi:hypothetical protein
VNELFGLNAVCVANLIVACQSCGGIYMSWQLEDYCARSLHRDDILNNNMTLTKLTSSLLLHDNISRILKHIDSFTVSRMKDNGQHKPRKDYRSMLSVVAWQGMTLRSPSFSVP